MRTLSCTAAVAFLAGCSGGGSPPPTAAVAVAGPNQTARSRVATSRVTPFVNVAGIKAPHGNQTFVTDAGTATVTVWGANGQLNAILFDGISAVPEGLATDAAQNLYVANLNFSNVIVYAKPYTSIRSTLNDAGQETEDVAVDKTGLVGVTNYLTTALAPGSVSFFAKNSTQPCTTVKDPNWIYFFNDAFDASGNLFIDGQTADGGTLVGEVTGGCKATSITTLNVGNTISWPGGVQVSGGNILIGDVNNQAIYTYAPPSGGSLGSPTVVTTLAGAVSPVTFAIEANGKHVRTADAAADTLYAGLYTYPKGGYVSKLADHLWAVAVAVYPPARP
ncbi:MAG: hypothetical protein WAK11_03475 [Candidatus Cybelea sp.]